MNCPTPEINCFDDLIQRVEQSTVPFILRQTKLFECSFEKFSQLASQQTTLLKGYSSSLTWEFSELKATDVLESWIAGNLKENIVDAPVDEKDLLLEAQNYLEGKLGQHYPYALCWVFTVAPKITHFHTDPTYAGGWMKLLEGEKIWWLVKPSDWQHLQERGHTVESCAEKDFDQMIQLEDGYLKDKIYCDTMRAGDLLWFPVGTLHKVITTKSSYGFGGYF